jgi:hypothetical protein
MAKPVLIVGPDPRYIEFSGSASSIGYKRRDDQTPAWTARDRPADSGYCVQILLTKE